MNNKSNQNTSKSPEEKDTTDKEDTTELPEEKKDTNYSTNSYLFTAILIIFGVIWIINKKSKIRYESMDSWIILAFIYFVGSFFIILLPMLENKVARTLDNYETPAFITGHSITHYWWGIVLGFFCLWLCNWFFGNYKNNIFVVIFAIILAIILHAGYEIVNKINKKRVDENDDGKNSLLNIVGDCVVSLIGTLLVIIFCIFLIPSDSVGIYMIGTLIATLSILPNKGD